MGLPADREYIISGTIDEMISILMSDFEMSEEEARFVVYILTNEKRDKVIFEEKDLTLWYLNEMIPNKSPIFDSPYTIALSKLKVETNHALFIFLGTLMLSREAAVVALGLDLIWALKQSIQKVSKRELCVYGRIVDFILGTKGDSFESDDIVPYDNDNECNRKPDKWGCPYWNNERCSLNMERIEWILEKLEEKKILTKTGQYWTMVK